MRIIVSLHPSPGVPILKLENIEIGTIPTPMAALWKVGMGPLRSGVLDPIDLLVGAVAREGLGFLTA